MRFLETETNEPGLVAQLLDERDGLARVLTVGLVVIGAGSHAPLAPVEFATSEIAPLDDLAGGRSLVGVRLVPRLRQIHPTFSGRGVASTAEVKYLAKRCCVVTVLPEQLR